jgi:hypothetical protein
VFGFFQSSGGPVGTAIMGNWFCDAESVKNRGMVFGTWTCHQYLGDIFAAVFTALVLKLKIEYWWALVVPALCNIGWGFLCMCVVSCAARAKRAQTAAALERPQLFVRAEASGPSVDRFLPLLRSCATLLTPPPPPRYGLTPDPEEIGIDTADLKPPKKTTDKVKLKPVPTDADGHVVEAKPIGFVEAFMIPNVAGYAMAFGFFKLTNYVLFFWLPYFLSLHFDPATANLVSTLYVRPT